MKSELEQFHADEALKKKLVAVLLILLCLAVAHMRSQRTRGSKEFKDRDELYRAKSQ